MADEFIGPALPPHLAEEEEKTNKKRESIDREEAPQPKKRRIMGPSFLDLVAEEKPKVVDNGPMIGPPPPSMIPDVDESVDNTDEQWEAVMKRNQVVQKEESKREDWMLSLPDGPRLQRIQNKNQKTFSKNAVLDLDNSWTKTPGGSSNTETSKSSYEKPQIYHSSAQRKKQGPSLLEMHQEKLRSEKKSTSGTSERLRWDRERDLLGKGKTMKSSDRDKIINDAATLHSRFTS